MVKSILENAGYKVGLIGTIEGNSRKSQNDSLQGTDEKT